MCITALAQAGNHQLLGERERGGEKGGGEVQLHTLQLWPKQQRPAGFSLLVKQWPMQLQPGVQDKSSLFIASSSVHPPSAWSNQDNNATYAQGCTVLITLQVVLSTSCAAGMMHCRHNQQL